MGDNELIEIVPEGEKPNGLEDGFKTVCAKLGLMMVIIFVSRTVCTVLASLMLEWGLFDGMGETAAYALESLMSLLFLYIIPMGCAAALLREPTNETRRRIYAKPVYFGNAMGMFPALYGVSIAVNFITMLIGLLFSETDLNKSFNTMNDLQPANMPCALILLFQLVVIAPLFEELWFRGIVMESLRPYGNGFAILVSGILFGMTHANFQQFFYATTLGICLGYIAVSTKSIVTTTIMHAMFNSVSGLLLLFMSVESVGDYLLASQSGESAEMTPAVVMYLVFLFLIILTMLIGLIMAAFKLRKIKKYKVPKVQTELSTGRRWGIFFTRAAVLIALVLAADTFTFQIIPQSIYRLFV